MKTPPKNDPPRRGRAIDPDVARMEKAAVYKSLSEPVFIYDAGGRMLETNPAGLALLGRGSLPAGTTAERLFQGASLKSPGGRAISPASLPSRQALKGRAASRCFILVNCAGRRAVIQSTASPLRSRGRILGAVDVWSDLTEREDLLADLLNGRLDLAARVQERTEALTKANADLWKEVLLRRRAETESRKTIQLLEKIFAGVDVHVAYLDASFNYVRVNRAFALSAGRRSGNLAGKNHFALFPSAEVRKIFAAVLETGKPHYAYEEPFFPHGPGAESQKSWDWSVQAVTDPAGKPEGLILSLIDVSHRQRSQFERGLLAAAIDQAREPIAVTDTEGTVRYSNLAFANLVGLSRSDVLGRAYYELGGEGLGRKEFEDAARSIVLRGLAWAGRIRRNKADAPAVLDVVITPLRDEEGRVSNFSIMERDISRELLFEERFRESQRLQALGTMAGGIAHDFNNLLMPIMISAELMLAEAQPGGPLHKQLQTVLAAAQRAKSLVSQITQFSRQAGRKRQPMRLQPVVREALTFVKSTLPANIELREKLEADRVEAEIDPTQIHQVVMNLCSNAVYAMKSEGGVLEVSLAEVEPPPADARGPSPEVVSGRYLRLSVSDTGMGIDPQVMGHIFEPFFTTKGPREGSGMGLAVVHGIVKAHKGLIRVQSDAGRRSAFHVYFSKADSPAPPKTPESRELPGGTERILLVDDDALALEGGKLILERLGYRVTAESESPKALSAFSRKPEAFDLVITDQVMPAITGSDLAGRILRLRPGVPIILCTGFADAIDEKKALALGLRGFLKKPFRAAELAAAIRKALAPGGPAPAAPQISPG